MSALHGTIKSGHIILDVPAALPEGTQVEILAINEPKLTPAMREEDWPTTPEGIAALLERMEQGWLSPEDDIAWRVA